MKTLTFCLALIVMSCTLVFGASVPGKVIYTFQGGSTGGYPSSLTLDPDGNLYGVGWLTCQQGSCNIVFKLSHNANGHWTYQTIYQFDGALGVSSLVLDAAGNLYGTTSMLGAYNQGNVFELTPSDNGTWVENVLYSFHGGGDGIEPQGGVALDSLGNLYGTTPYGGSNGEGTIFELKPSGGGAWTESVIYNFRGSPFFDGENPIGPLTIDGAGNLYGVTPYGGNATLYGCQYTGAPNGCGVVFQLAPNTDGTWTESVLWQFSGYSADDGAWPSAGVTLDSAGNLYGTTVGGGLGYSGGTAFELSPNVGGEFWTENLLYRFNKATSYPYGSVIFDKAGNIYGESPFGPIPPYQGAIYRLTPSQQKYWRFTSVYSFSGNSDGDEVSDSLVTDSAGHIYGSTIHGGNKPGNQGAGVIFEGQP